MAKSENNKTVTLIMVVITVLIIGVSAYYFLVGSWPTLEKGSEGSNTSQTNDQSNENSGGSIQNHPVNTERNTSRKVPVDPGRQPRD